MKHVARILAVIGCLSSTLYGEFRRVDSIGVVFTTGVSSSAVIKDSFLYVADATSAKLKIYNIANPALPTLRSSTTVTFQGLAGQKIVVRNTLAYVLASMQVWNISNPAAPTLLSTATGGGGSESVVVSGNTAYTTHQFSQTGYVSSYDVTDSTASAFSDTFNNGSSYSKGIAVLGSTAFVCWHEQGLLVLDVSNPASIALLVRYTRKSYDYYEFCCAEGNYLYVLTAADSAKLRIFDVTTPVSLVEVGNVALPGWLGAGGNGMCCVKMGNYILASQLSTAGNQHCWDIIDVTTPASPILVYTKYTTSTGYTTDMVPISNGYFYTFTGGQCVLYRLKTVVTKIYNSH